MAQQKDPQPSQEELDAIIRAGTTPVDDDDDNTPADYGNEVVDEDPEPEPEPAPEPEPEPKDEPKDPEPEPKEDEPKDPDAEEPPKDPEPEPEPEPEPGKKGKEPRIPKSRFDEVNERRKAAEKRAAELEAELNGKKPEAEKIDFDFDAKEKEYMDAVLDGEAEKAQALRREIREAEQQLYRQSATEVADQTVSTKESNTVLAQAIADAEQRFAELDANSEGFNEELAEEVLAMQRGYIEAQKLSPAAALRKAVDRVARSEGLTDRMAEPDPEPEPETPAKAPEPKPTEQQTREKLAAAEKQPPAMPAGKEEPAIDLDNISEEEYDALPESTIRRLRGDFA